MKTIQEQIEVMQHFASMSDAARAFNISIAAISAAIKRNGTSAGYKWSSACE